MRTRSAVVATSLILISVVCSAVFVGLGKTSTPPPDDPVDASLPADPNVDKQDAEPAALSDSASILPLMQSPFPDVTIPGIPTTGQCCLWQVEKRVDGKREATFSNPYQCDTGQTARGKMGIKVTLRSAGRPCDQQDIPPDGSTLVASGTVLRRNDRFAHFIGDFSITNPAGKVLFKGTLEAIDRLGSHHLFFKCEACNPQSHLEGWLVGRGTDELPNHTIRALLVARGTVPSPTVPSTALVGSLNGVLVKCP